MAISINGITVAGIGKDGKNGVDGKDATINGVNALTIKPTGGLTGQQSGDTYTIDGSGLVPKTTTVNGKPLSGNVSLAAGDVGADPTGSAASALSDAKAYADGLTAADVGALPISGGTLTGQLNCGGRLLRGVANPTTGQDAVNLQYAQANFAPKDSAGGTGKRVCRFVVGTSTAGWTESDCDYLCDGTDDQVEINAAIQALPSGGGEIVILDGTYNITAAIAMNKDNVKLSGNGNFTVLKRMWDSFMNEGVITITATNGGCCVENIFVDGNRSAYSSNSYYGIYLSSSSNNTVTGNTCNNNSYGIYLSSSSNNTVTGNTCNNNSSNGIYLSGSSNNTVTGNTCTCNNNSSNGIYLSSSSNNTVTGNTCNNNSSNGIYLSGSSNNTVTGNTCNSYYGIYLSSSSNNTVTGNTCNNNSYGIYLSNNSNEYSISLSGSSNDYSISLSGSSNNTVTGNTCNNNNYGIYLSNNSNNTVTGNTCNNNNYGIYLSNNSNNTVTGNTCNNNSYGIYLSSSSNNTVTGNTCIRGNGTSSDYTRSQHTIYLFSTKNDYNLISSNNIMGKNYVSSGGTGNTFVNNKYN